MKDLAIVGAGGFGKEVRTLVDHINQRKPTWNLLGFYDDQPLRQVQGLPVIGSVEELVDQPQKPRLVIAIGNPGIRCKIVASLKASGASFAALVHPTVVIGEPQTVKIGGGSIITAGVIMTTDIQIGEHVIINLNTTIGHDTAIADFCAIMPGVNLAGNVKLEKGVYIGAGANVLGGTTLGEFCTIGAGAVVTRDIPAHTTAVGVPARVLKNTD